MGASCAERWWPILQSPTTNPGQIPPLVRVAYAYEYALNTLKYAGTVLAQAMEP